VAARARIGAVCPRRSGPAAASRVSKRDRPGPRRRGSDAQRPAVEEPTKDDFEVTDNGERREIVHFGHREEPLDLVLLFDTSLSMQPVVERIAQTGRAALGELRSGDRLAVMAFSNGTDLILDFTEQFDAVEAAVQRVLQRPFIPNSELQGGIDDAAQHFLKQPRSSRRRAILAITDGLGNGRARGAVKNLWERTPSCRGCSSAMRG